MDFRKKFSYAANSLVIIISVLVIIFLINIFAGRHFFRLDFTQNNMYSISDGTKNILKNLDDKVMIKAYFSGTLPPQLKDYPKITEDILNEYKKESKGKLNYRFLDPGKKSEYAEEAREIGIQETSVGIVKANERSLQNVFLGLGIFYRDKRDIITNINLSNLEYDLTSAIKNATKTRNKIIGFVKGHGILDIRDSAAQPGPYFQFGELLNQNYEVQQIDLKDQDLNEIDTLIVAGPKENFGDEELFKIDQFLVKGGSAIFIIDEFGLDANLQPVDISTDLNRIYESFGIKVKNGYILDQNNTYANFPTANGQIFIPYPYWVQTLNSFMNKENPVTANLDGIIFPWVNALEITKKENIKVKKLIESSSTSLLSEKNINLDPNFANDLIKNLKKEDSKSHLIAALIQVNYNSIFNEPPIIKEENDILKNATSNLPILNENKKGKNEFVKESQKKTNIAMLSSSYALMDYFLMQFNQNMAFFLNLVDYMTIDPALIEIRSKGVNVRTIKNISNDQKNSIKAIGVLGMPILIAGIGIFRFWRRKQKKKVKATY